MADQAAAPVPFEKGIEALEEIVKRLETGDLPLEEALTLFERGMTLSAACRKQLEAAEARVERLVRQGETVVAEPFEG
jgi:exodeoxyribonuclease VII small subunit